MRVVKEKMLHLILSGLLLSSFWIAEPAIAEDQSRLKSLYEQILKSIDSLNNRNKSTCPPNQTAIPSEKDRWQQAGFTNANIASVDLEKVYDKKPTSSKFTHQFDLTLVMFRDARWSSQQIEARLKRVTEVYEQCGIRVNSAKLIIADSPIGTSRLDRSWGGRDMSIASKVPASATKPVIFFVDSSLDGNYAYSGPKYFSGGTALENTAWITYDDEEVYKKIYDKSYSVESHELGHLFGNCHHQADGVKNLMANQIQDLNDKLNPNQCSEFKKSEMMRKL